jgi:hypothetical protein
MIRRAHAKFQHRLTLCGWQIVTNLDDVVLDDTAVYYGCS